MMEVINWLITWGTIWGAGYVFFRSIEFVIKHHSELFNKGDDVDDTQQTNEESNSSSRKHRAA